ncbi:MAG TPA: HAD family hydrolase [Bacteroidota bacterium]|nr:HAD family hydrolase [Bacteroidota bacterium]
MIKAITLDFWDTIFKMDFEIDLNAYRIQKLEEIIRKYGYNFQKEKIFEVYKDVHKEFDRKWIDECYTMTTSEVLKLILSKLQLSISVNDFEYLVKIFQEAILLNPPSVMDGSKQAIIELYKEYKLGIISDTGFSPGKILRNILKENGLIDYFSVLIFSDEYGKSKPHPDNFLYAAKELGVDISSLAHIGDNERTDVIGAISAGAKGIFYTKELDLKPVKSSPSAILKNWSDIHSVLNQLNRN